MHDKLYIKRTVDLYQGLRSEILSFNVSWEQDWELAYQEVFLNLISVSHCSQLVNCKNAVFMELRQFVFFALLFCFDKSPPIGLITVLTAILIVGQLYGRQIVVKFNNENSCQKQTTNHSQHQHSLPVNFNYFIFNSTISSQHQRHKFVHFNTGNSRKINSENYLRQKEVFWSQDQHLLPFPMVRHLNAVKINNSKFHVNKLGSSSSIANEWDWKQNCTLARWRTAEILRWRKLTKMVEIIAKGVFKRFKWVTEWISVNAWLWNSGKLDYSFGKCSSSFAKRMSLCIRPTGKHWFLEMTNNFQLVS